MIKAFVVAIAIAATVSQARAGTRPVVVELFTSQGCSSCPPADAFLAELATRPGVLALGFHVDYWDKLGWKDPLSATGSTERQHQYAKWFGRRELYTPQMVVDGRREFVGSDRNEINAAIALRPAAIAPVSFSDDRKSVTVGAGDGYGKVLLVRYVLTRSNAVSAGENAGRMATDVDAVTVLKPLGDWKGSALTYAVDPPTANEGVAVLVQADDGLILGAGSAPHS
ncbi:MAG TPA: DUF1223 domain-containing protein [Alphaproteobacteria bacterium]|nr:DUF1223 domain-containing protein [Alphaproteobacteria bacterium]